MAPVPRAGVALPALGRGHGPSPTSGLVCTPAPLGQGQGEPPASAEYGTRVAFALLHVLLLSLGLGVGEVGTVFGKETPLAPRGTPPALASCGEQPPEGQTAAIARIANPRSSAPQPDLSTQSLPHVR